MDTSAGHVTDAYLYHCLGVQCAHCHAGTAPNFNYAADEKPTKEVAARKMIQMVMHINDEHLKGIGSAEVTPPAAGAPPPLGAGPQKVTCFTCHRGALKPDVVPRRRRRLLSGGS